jgi:hypothetical protein
MDERPTKRRGPLTWLGESVRRRPALTVSLALLLTVFAFVSVGFTVLYRRDRLENARQFTTPQQQQDALKFRYLQPQKRPDPEPEPPTAPDPAEIP